MIVVVEGPDNAGKSTLIEHLSRKLNIASVPGEGPAKSEGEINDRVERYLKLDNVIFDRHPCVSQRIYNLFRSPGAPKVRSTLVDGFYDSDVLLIYCRGRVNVGMEGHKRREDVDTDGHMLMVNKNYTELCEIYDSWASRHAHINYRIGDGYGLVTRLVGEAMRLTFNPLEDIEEFHSKFGLEYDGPPRILPRPLAEFRVKFMYEEVNEYAAHDEAAYTESEMMVRDKANYTYHLENMLDALVDEMYVLLGTAHMQGFTEAFPEAWRRVHYANMQKVRAKSADDSKRNSPFDVIKPLGWKPASLVDLVEVNDVTSSSADQS